jgi:hypothetical protein
METGDWKLENGNSKLETPKPKVDLETGNWKLEDRNLMPVGACLRHPTSRPDAASYERSQGLERMPKDAAVDTGE